MKVTLFQVSKLLAYAAIFSVVIVMSSTFFPFIGGKYYFFRACVEMSIAFLLLWWAFEAPVGELEEKVRRVFGQPLFIAVSAFVLAFMLATIFADNPGGAFWSNFERGEGGFQMLHYYAFYVLLLILVRDEREWRFFFQLSLVAGALMILYGVGAQFGWTMINFISPYTGGPIPESFWGKLQTARFQGSLGNPAYVAPYLMFIIFYALYLWFVGLDGERSKLQAYGYPLFAFVCLMFFGFSQTRGAFIGLAAGVLTFAVVLGLLYPKSRKVIMVTLGLFVVLGLVLLQYRDSPLVQALPGSRFLSISLNDSTVQTRFWTWGSAWEGFLARPIFGWGPENFSTVFDRYFNAHHFIPGVATETWFDRAHSVFFEYLSTTGTVGFLAYFGIFFIFSREFLRWMSRRRMEEHLVTITPEGVEHPVHAHHFLGPFSTALVRALLVSLPFAYLVQGLFLFDVLPIYMNLFLFMAFATFQFNQSSPTHS